MKIMDTKNSDFSRFFSKILKERMSFKIELEQKIKQIFRQVEKKGIKAVIEFAKKFDGFSGNEKELRVTDQELSSAIKELSSEEAQALKLAEKRIKKFHRKQIPKEYSIKENDSELKERWIPLNCVGIYVPAGKAPLASTVLMTVIPAKLAGVKRIVLATPGGREGKVHPAILFSAQLAGVSEIYKIGGAHAIAGMALGASPLPKVEKIVGPGGIWVSAAKLYAHTQGLIGVDTLAGPSELVIISDGSVKPEFASADLKAQLEHGQDGWAFLLSTDFQYLQKVQAQIKLQGKNLFFIKSRSEKEMVELANLIAPEHLEIHTRKPELLLPYLTAPSAVYLGADSPVALGDYLVGPNHCLPTGGRALFDSPLGVWDFMKRQSVVRLSKTLMKKLGEPAIKFAELEGLKAHRDSVKIRLK